MPRQWFKFAQAYRARIIKQTFSQQSRLWVSHGEFPRLLDQHPRVCLLSVRSEDAQGGVRQGQNPLLKEWNKWKKLTWNFSPAGFRLQMFEVLQLHIWFSWGRLTCFCSGFKRSTVGLLGQLVCAWAKQRQPPLDHSTRFCAVNEMQTRIVLGFLIWLLDFPT